jgi:L-ascorbate metabolism protein UlaG (beta-lactamase superfamily)
MNKGGTIDTAGVIVTMTHADHSSDIDVGETAVPGGEAAGFVIRAGNSPAIYHAGDTQVFGDMAIIRELYSPEIALLPIGGLYTMGPREAALAVKLLAPRKVIGMHYGTFPQLSGTPAQLKSFLAPELAGLVAELIPGMEQQFEFVN